MSKFKNIVWLGVLAMTATVTSCSDYLETPPTNLLGSDSFYQTATQSEQGLLGVYSDLGQISNYEYLHMSECRSDNMWTQVIPNGLREYAEINTFRADKTLGMFNDTWNLLYKLIYDANVAIAKMEGCAFTNEAVKKQFMGEAHFMRGWAYFELTRLFGNVPMVTAAASPSEVKAIGQSAPKDILDKVVVPDLQYAIENLPYQKSMLNAKGASISTQGRADKIAATAMLARVYMTMAGFPYNDSSAKALAKSRLEEVLNYSAANSNMYWAPTLDEWRKQWLPSYNNKYSIFAIQHTLGESRNYLIFNMSPALPSSYTARRIFGNNIYVEKTLEYEFERTYANGNVDGRGLGFTTLNGYDAETNYVAYSNEKENVTIDGVEHQVYARSFFYKYIPTKHKLAALGEKFDETTLAGDYDWPVNFPVLRLEDMMLMYAEILAETNPTEAITYVNKIRERAGCDLVSASNSADAMKLIKRERRVELAGEGVRWFDQVRYGEWQSDIQNMFDRYGNPDGAAKTDVSNGRYLYPIPQDQMNAVPGLYNQNTDY